MLTLSVVYECAMRNFQRAPFTIWHFSKTVPALRRAHPLQVQVGFYQSIVYIGKADRGKGEEWKGHEGKNTSHTKAKEKKIFFLYQYRLKNDIRHLWKLASELLMHLFHLPLYLVGIFKKTLSELWHFRHDFYPHQVVSIYRNFYEKKKIK